MKKLLFLFLPLMVLLFSPVTSASASEDDHPTKVEQHDHEESSHNEVAHAAHSAHHSEAPAGWSVIPFVLLLLMIATGPLFFEHFWHHHYPKVAVLLGALVISYYIWALHNGDQVIHTLAEYIQFIALLAGLFMASGGILIKVDKEGTPMANMIMLIIGAVLANVIGTTGASMLLIRPFIRLNKGRIQAYHIIFFIFMVSNVGGSLTPIGDPPLFLGFLKGVPFEWTIIHNIVPWAFAIMVLAAVFYIMDSKNKKGAEEGETPEYTGKMSIQGSKNFLWILIIIGAVFLDPNVFDWVPGIHADIHGHVIKFSYIRECIMLAVAFFSYYFADQQALKGNEFEFEPIKEVAFIFIGIFFTMMPALELVSAYAQSPEGGAMIGINSLYWGTGVLSGVLDNAPTYLNFATAAIANDGGTIASMEDVRHYAFGDGKFAGTESVVRLTAISVASVFFGAMTYIGNAPNFMVKSIAEQNGIKMPSFFGYVTKYSLVILLPILLLVWVIFFYFNVIELVIPGH